MRPFSFAPKPRRYLASFLIVGLAFLANPRLSASAEPCPPSVSSLVSAKIAFLKRPSPARPAPFSLAESQTWQAFLQAVQRAKPCLTAAFNLQIRHLLENEGDRDRNRFQGFPETLSLRIVSLIVALDRLRLRPLRPFLSSSASKAPSPPRTEAPSKAKDSPGSPPSSASRGSGETKEVYGDASLVTQPPMPPTSGGETPKALETDSDAPPVEYTERDIERFLPPQTLLIWPVTSGRMSSGYGLRRDPFSRKIRFHNGIDLSVPFGTQVRAAAPGRVIATGWMGACGLGVMIAHDKGLSTAYCHLSQILALRDSTLERGTLLGRVGSTGRSTRPHLHFSVYLHQRAINPLRFLPRR